MKYEQEVRKVAFAKDPEMVGRHLYMRSSCDRYLRRVQSARQHASWKNIGVFWCRPIDYNRIAIPALGTGYNQGIT